MILITTAGKVGSEAARLLAAQGEPVRVLVRDPGKARPLADAGVELAVGDLDVPASIDEAMEGVSAVVLVSSAVVAQELNVVASAARAGVGHIVKASSKASMDSPIARRRGQAEIEEGLAASGVAHTILRSNAYMQNVLILSSAIAKTSSFGSSAGNDRIGMVDVRDVAAVAVLIAVTPAPHVGRTYWLTGPELISNHDVAAALSQQLGRKITYRELSFDEDVAAAIAAGVPAPIARLNSQAFSLIADGDASGSQTTSSRCSDARRTRLRSSSATTPARSPRPESARGARSNRAALVTGSTSGNRQSHRQKSARHQGRVRHGDR